MQPLFSQSGWLSPLRRASFRPWRELALICLVIMDMSWTALWYRSLPYAGLQVSYWRAFGVFSAMVLTAYLLAYLVSALKTRWLVQRGLFAVILLGGVIAGLKTLMVPHARIGLGEFLNMEIDTLSDYVRLIPPEVVTVVFVLLVWFRGVSLAEEPIEPPIVMAAFRTGIFWLVLFGLFRNTFVPEAWRAVSMFLFAGLLAMSTARIGLLSKLRGGRLTPFTWQWFTGLIGAVLSVTVLAGYVALLVRSLANGYLGEVIAAVKEVLLFLFLILVMPVLSLLVYVLMNFGEMINFEQVMELVSEIARRLIAFSESIFGPQPDPSVIQFPYVRLVLVGGFLLILVLVVVVLWGIRFLNERDVGADQLEPVRKEFGVSDWGLSKLGQQIWALGNRLARRIGLRPVTDWWHAARIRRIYIQMMILSEKLGKPRPEAQTPLEFLPTLTQTFPGMNTDLATITEAYLKVRYGEVPETFDEIRSVESAWSRVLKQGKLQLRSSPVSPQVANSRSKRKS